jgi:hypothetical protein
MRYVLPMGKLMACPFCRELYGEPEARRCPTCDVVLQPLDKLPPSPEALEEEALSGEATAPEDRLLPVSYMGRGRGALLVLSALGLFLFFMPWVEMQRPEMVAISGYDLARTRAGWLWGGAVGWFILLPLVWTRRTLYKMRGVRIICATFAAMIRRPARHHRAAALDHTAGGRAAPRRNPALIRQRPVSPEGV